MAQDQEMNLLLLMGADATAVRANHTFNLLEVWINSQKRSRLDTVFAFVSGLTTLIGYLALFQVPESLPLVVLMSAVVIGIAAILWWWRRHTSYGEALRTMRRFGIYLDQMRRFDRQLQLADQIQEAKTNVEAIRELIRRSLGRSTDTLCSLKADMDYLDYFTLNEEEDAVWSEIDSIRQRYGFGPD